VIGRQDAPLIPLLFLFSCAYRLLSCGLSNARSRVPTQARDPRVTQARGELPRPLLFDFFYSSRTRPKVPLTNGLLREQKRQAEEH